jgi:hypothetical protein
MSLILTPDELTALTDCSQSAAQIRWLQAHKWPFVVGRSGRPKVARSFFESVIGAHREVEKKVHVGLDFAALDALTNKQ